MMKLIQNKDLLASMNKYMFNRDMFKGFTSTFKEKNYAMASPILAMATPTLALPAMASPILALPAMASPILALPILAAPTKQKNAKPFVPFQKDKLFWCFYIILHGYEEYEMNRSNSFSIEKQIKIETVEKLKTVKDQLKELKLKRTELEDELVNKHMITTKGLCALCLVHNVSITYVYGRKYCEIAPAQPTTKGIIMQNEKKEDSLKWTSNEMNTNADFLTQIRADYWFIENIQKPLNAPSAYTLNELQEIANKLQIATHNQVNEKSKAKTKTALYEEILQTI
jgi:hypothetical protein